MGVNASTPSFISSGGIEDHQVAMMMADSMYTASYSSDPPMTMSSQAPSFCSNSFPCDGVVPCVVPKVKLD